MTRAQARRKKRRKAKMQRALGWTLIFAFEFIVSAAPAAITAAFLIPMANTSRHYPGIGGEWIVIMLVFCLVFKAVHERSNSSRWLGFAITGTITRRRSNNWLKTKIKEYAASGATPELTIQGIMNDANSDYYAAHGSDVTTVVGCVLTGDLPLTALDSEGQVVDDAINFNGKDLV